MQNIKLVKIEACVCERFNNGKYSAVKIFSVLYILNFLLRIRHRNHQCSVSFCGNTESMRDVPYWKNSLKLIELSSINIFTVALGRLRGRPTV